MSHTAGLRITGVDVDLSGSPVLRGVDLTVRPGQFVGLVGPNGSGKSTLLRTVYRSIRPTAGAILVDGDDLRSLSARTAAQRTAAVVQDGSDPAGLTVTELVALGRNPHHGLLSRESGTDRTAVAEALTRTGTADFAHRTIGSLSGGERQRVLLARAIAQQPRLLVLDELTNHLDIRARFEMLDLVRGLGITTLAVLHELDLAARCCDSLVVLDRGHAIAAGPVLNTLTPAVLAEVFGVNATAALGGDGVIRITYDAEPLADPAPTGSSLVLTEHQGKPDER
ncbi:ABC transporter ATP-binding protein [Actinokineospora sp. PR83]|uniref:ABC transporter ATP-binding protein n=1 Tax=Actinokineospora sp. PR83 TaxID=2884908 RepID=UPI001F3A7497|nr:ABC transporter ATP-binding protein [Actinokineospora sp. PR83]MCG8914471.1 ABC transporter ATP-binding protein [Actinokineospora sp. PR83]